MKNNIVKLVGTVTSSPRIIEIPSKSSADVDVAIERAFCYFDMTVKRVSGTEDIIPVIFNKDFVGIIKEGDRVSVVGEYRSYNVPDGKHTKLLLVVYAENIQGTTEVCSNYIELTGVLCKNPIYRTTPLGRDICDLLVAVSCSGRSVYIPCIVWGKLAGRCKNLRVGDKIGLEGRIQSREYEKSINGKIEKRMAWEMSVGKAKFFATNNRDSKEEM